MTDDAKSKILAELPAGLRTALEAQDATAFQCALDELPSEQASEILQQLEAAGIVGIGLMSEAEFQSILAQAIASSIPPAILQAIQMQDEAAFDQAMQTLSPADRQLVAGQLARLQAQADAEAEKWLDNLPDDVRLAVMDRDALRLQLALQDLPPAHAQEILDQLEAAGVLEELDEHQADLLMDEFEPLAQAAASVIQGNDTARPLLEALLADMDEQGWHLSAAVQRIWNGERDLLTLSEGLEHPDIQIVQRILTILE
jgi:Cdc37 C terminal domain